MEVKALELRDEGTFIPILCVNMNPVAEDYMVTHGAQKYLLRRCGYPCDGTPNILMTRLDGDGSPASNDPYHWGGRTYPVAHDWIIDHWNELSDGDVVDVQFILGETTIKKRSERFSVP